MSEFDIIKTEDIQNRIYTIRGIQVMLDNDIAEFYGVETKRLNEQVKRNIGRFPKAFMFQLSETDFNDLKSQFATSSWGGRRKIPYAFTEQGVAMLSAVLGSETAVKVSVQIMSAFVAMRRFMLSNAQVFQRLGTLELKQLETDQKLDKVLTAIESREIQPRQGIFFDGQVFDAYQFVSDLFRTAVKSIIIIDNYIDDTVLTHLGKRNKNVKVTIFTKGISRQLALDIKKFNEQYQPVEVKEFNNSHDRFLIIDDKTVYHFGASLKDLGKKWFAFSMFDKEAISILSKLPGGNI
jgi:hypothetical protein